MRKKDFADPIVSMRFILDELEANVLSPTQAIERMMILQGTSKSWQTSFWKQRRLELIKDRCEQCGSEKPPMVMQHLFHPPKLNVLVKHYNYQDWLVLNPLPPIDEETIGKREACPVCGSINIRYRLKQGDRICTKCKAIVTETITVTDVHAVSDYKQAHYQKFLSWCKLQVPDKITVKTWIEGNIRYLLLDDCVTFCKKCAYLWDVKSVHLCVGCKTHWISIRATYCKECDASRTST